MLRRLGAFILALAWPAFVHAQDTNVIPLMGGTAAPSVYVGPGDKVGSATAWYSCARAYSSTQADGTHTSCEVRNIEGSITASTATNVLTVSAVAAGSIHLNETVLLGTNGIGNLVGIVNVDATNTTGSSCNGSACTGNGGTGTYQVSVSGSNASQSMTVSEHCNVLLTTAGAFGNTTGCDTTGSNGSVLSTFCGLNSGSCWVVKLFNQVSPGSLDLVQTTTPKNQPPLRFASSSPACITNGICWGLTTSSAVNLTSANNVTPATGVVTFEAVYNRETGTTSSFILLTENGSGAINRITTFTAINKFNLAGGATNAQATASDTHWHAAIGVMNTTSSAINVDGTEATSLSVTGTTTAGAPQTTSPGANETDVAEAGFWDNIAFTTGGAGQTTGVCNNAQAFYGPGNFAGTGTDC